MVRGGAQMSQKLIVMLATLAALVGHDVWAAADGSSPGTSEPLQEVTVTAHRAELAARVSKFVNEIADRENGEGLPRWKAPVCPLVSGLPRPGGEFMLGRITGYGTVSS